MSDREQIHTGDEPVPEPESGEPKRVLTIHAHPDDVEFSCGGTVARWAAEGSTVTLCIVTNGDKGSDDPEMTPELLAAIRKEEQQAAADILGVSEIVYLGRHDGLVVADIELRRDITREIRRIKPDVVLAGDPSQYWFGSEYINHPDHRAVAEAAMGAIFPSTGNRLYFPELLIEGFEPHKVHEVYMTSFGDTDTVVDISDHMDTKIEALRAHKSQMGDWDPNDRIREWNAEAGKRHDPPVAYAEQFRYFKIGG